MTDFAAIDRRPSSVARITTAVVIALLAFALGIALAYYWLEHRPRALVAAAPSAATPPAATPIVIQPAAPAVATAPASVAATDPATLATRTNALAGQLAALEARTASVSVTAAGASGQAGRAEAMLVAFAARRAIDRGLALGPIEGQLRSRFDATQPQAALAVIRGARQPVTIEDLRGGFDAVAGDLASGSGGGWWPGLRTELGSLVVLHKLGAPSPLPADRLARVRRLLDAGRVDAALAEVAQLPGAAQASAWTAAARRYVDTHRALDTLEGAALLGQVG